MGVLQRRKHFSGLWNILIIATILTIVLLLLLYLSTVRDYEKYNNSIVENNSYSIVSSLETAVKNSSVSVLDASQTMDFLVFSNSTKPTRVTKYATSLSVQLQRKLSSYEEVIGFILYNAPCDRFYNYYFYQNYHNVHTNLSYGTITSATEHVTRTDIFTHNGKPYIIHTFQQRYGTIGVIIDPERNDNFRSFRKTSLGKADLYFRNSDETALAENPLITTLALDDLPLTLCYERSNSGFFFGQTSTHIIFFVLICFVIIIVAAIWLVIRQKLIAPLALLSESFDIVSRGNSSYRIAKNSTVKQIDSFYRGFDRMLDNIQAAEAESTKHQMDAVQAKLQYLQLQIRPHFYLNCLKNINSLAAMHENQKIQDMVIFLSDYFRYSFQDTRSFVSLQEELEAVQSYANLSQLLENPVSLEFDVESDVLPGKCLPLSILTFLENSIKHSKNSKNVVRISAKMFLTHEGDPYVRVTVEDNGKGFSDEMLDYLNSADPTKPIYRKDRVGIANVRYRLWYTYRDKASLSFENRDTNAVATITFPFESIYQ